MVGTDDNYVLAAAEWKLLFGFTSWCWLVDMMRCGGSLLCGQMLDIPGNRTQARPAPTRYSSTYLTTTPSSSFISKVQGRTKTFWEQFSSHMLRSPSG